MATKNKYGLSQEDLAKAENLSKMWGLLKTVSPYSDDSAYVQEARELAQEYARQGRVDELQGPLTVATQYFRDRNIDPLPEAIVAQAKELWVKNPSNSQGRFQLERKRALAEAKAIEFEIIATSEKLQAPDGETALASIKTKKDRKRTFARQTAEIKHLEWSMHALMYKAQMERAAGNDRQAAIDAAAIEDTNKLLENGVGNHQHLVEIAAANPVKSKWKWALYGASGLATVLSCVAIAEAYALAKGISLGGGLAGIESLAKSVADNFGMGAFFGLVGASLTANFLSKGWQKTWQGGAFSAVQYAANLGATAIVLAHATPYLTKPIHMWQDKSWTQNFNEGFEWLKAAPEKLASAAKPQQNALPNANLGTMTTVCDTYMNDDDVQKYNRLSSGLKFQIVDKKQDADGTWYHVTQNDKNGPNRTGWVKGPKCIVITPK